MEDLDDKSAKSVTEPADEGSRLTLLEKTGQKGTPDADWFAYQE